MNLQIRRNFANQPDGGQILNNDAIGTGARDDFDLPRGFAQFVFENKCIKSYVAADATGMQFSDGGRKFFIRKARFGARGEFLEAKINGVGTGFDSGAQLRPVPGGALHFGFTRCAHQVKKVSALGQ